MGLREFESRRYPPGSFNEVGPLPPPAFDIARAVAINRTLARQLGWGCVVGAHVTPIAELVAFLRLAVGATEEDLVRAVLAFQRGVMHIPGDGQLGPETWEAMHRQRPPVLPRPAFTGGSWPVAYNGETLGVLEKIAPYRRCFFSPTRPRGACRPDSNGVAGEVGGATIELGFRVIDMAAVRRAGFINAAGEDQFRWIQTVEFVTVPSAAAPTGFVRRASHVIDPTTLVGAIPDAHPYYWDEVTPAGSSPGFLIGHFLNRPSRDPDSNHLCYDLIFEDAPGFPLSVARPGLRAYFNFEVALVGVRSGRQTQNVVLNTVNWGFDLVVDGPHTDVKLNRLGAGTFGGSPTFKRILSAATNAGAFPGHCFVGGGFTGRSPCP